jgi:hypothetical protein
MCARGDTPRVERLTFRLLTRPYSPLIACSSPIFCNILTALDVFRKQLKKMAKHTASGHEIIPDEIYIRDYIGGTLANLIRLRLKYDGQSSFIQD